MNPKRDLTQPSESVFNNGYDNVENDYILRVSDLIITPEGKEYEIMDLMGKGTFGQVVKCECKILKEVVAIKVIKNKKAFKNQGVVEIKILDIINRVYDPSGDTALVRMLDFFVFRDHLCIVFELLSYSLYDMLKKNNFQGVSLNTSRLIIIQILDAVKIIKDAKLIHCDLKPENILLKS
jgi:dual specificity protein kinase YAK1